MAFLPESFLVNILCVPLPRTHFKVHLHRSLIRRVRDLVSRSFNSRRPVKRFPSHKSQSLPTRPPWKIEKPARRSFLCHLLSASSRLTLLLGQRRVPRETSLVHIAESPRSFQTDIYAVSMAFSHTQSSPNTRSNQPRLKIDPFAMSHCLPHLPPEDYSPQSMSSSSSSFLSANTSVMSPYSSSHSTQASLPPTPEEDGTLWNLVPYDVPWGQDYFAYKAGRLPGPDGDCLFLRSPTPIEKKRTVRACEKCRERKAKVRVVLFVNVALSEVRW